MSRKSRITGMGITSSGLEMTSNRFGTRCAPAASGINSIQSFDATKFPSKIAGRSQEILTSLRLLEAKEVGRMEPEHSLCPYCCETSDRRFPD